MSMDEPLFDATTLLEPAKTPDPLANADREALTRLAFCYTATETGNCSGIRFMMSISDAQTWCTSDLSRGELYGTQWAYMWTSAWNYINHYSDPSHPQIVTRGLVDNNEWDDLIAGLNLTKIPINDFAAVLTPLGVEVK